MFGLEVRMKKTYTHVIYDWIHEKSRGLLAVTVIAKIRNIKAIKKICGNLRDVVVFQGYRPSGSLIRKTKKIVLVMLWGSVRTKFQVSFFALVKD